ncbi:cell envelope integrity protein TolA [Alkalimarinus alittae]|uniref:Energy transducer TonB n=1 Tax=Alkalimarinus alittae TaxID=2961619 RepID=A0ABY6MY53_9ALTE|nr:energy transducer TonB [Alkalimarinus alittae]UZE94768.1 energy transducer TonB [Alkalimarinus alittae]
MLNNQSKIIFSVLLIVSILLHILVWWWVDINELFKPDPVTDSTTVQVTLQQPKVPPPPPVQKPPPPEQKTQQPKSKPKKQQPPKEKLNEERHLPMHNADTFASSNNTDHTAKKIKNDKQVGNADKDLVGDKTKDNKKEELKAEKTEKAKAKTVATNLKNADKNTKTTDKKPDIAETNSEQKSKQVYSENQSDELKMVNLYLARMKQQIIEKIIQPRNPVRPGRGAISFDLGSDGYLISVEIVKSSGDFVLDLTVLEAVKRVHRFDVPSSKAIAAKYYKDLVFYYDENILKQ